MKQLSKRHHYIPQYYLKGFTNENGLFYLYEVLRNRMDKNLHNTDSLFFEKNRNIIRYKGQLSDIIEDYYTDFDTIFANLFREIKKGVSEDELFNSKIMVCIKQFLALFLCRLPVIDEQIDFILDNLDFSKTRNIITIDGKNVLTLENSKKLLSEDKNFRYFFRCFILPILIFDLRAEDEGRWYLLQGKDMLQHHVCCDVPVLIKNLDLANLLSFNTDFIFPLTKDKLLIHSMKKDICMENLASCFYIEVDLLLLWKAQKYVVCSNEEYLKHLIELKTESEKEISFDKFNERIFDMLKKA